MRAWNDLAVQTVQHPQEWMDTLFRYQRDQMSLWLRLFTAPGSELPAPLVLLVLATGACRAGVAENPVFDYPKRSYLLASNMLTGR